MPVGPPPTSTESGVDRLAPTMQLLAVQEPSTRKILWDPSAVIHPRSPLGSHAIIVAWEMLAWRSARLSGGRLDVSMWELRSRIVSELPEAGFTIDR